jgi:hypothetical protein
LEAGINNGTSDKAIANKVVIHAEQEQCRIAGRIIGMLYCF